MPHNRPETAAVQESCRSSVARGRRTVIERVSVALHKTGLSSASASTCSGCVSTLVCCHGGWLRHPSTEARPPLRTAASLKFWRPTPSTPPSPPALNGQSPPSSVMQSNLLIFGDPAKMRYGERLAESNATDCKLQRLLTQPYGQGQLQRLPPNLGPPHSPKGLDLSDTPSTCHPLRGTAY